MTNKPDTFTLQQARNTIAAAAARHYSPAEIAERLQLLHPTIEIKTGASKKSLAHSLAWALLPAYRTEATPCDP
jgi:IS30 family transposase